MQLVPELGPHHPVLMVQQRSHADFVADDSLFYKFKAIGVPVVVRGLLQVNSCYCRYC